MPRYLPGDIVQGTDGHYRFTGGNQQDQANWQPVAPENFPARDAPETSFFGDIRRGWNQFQIALDTALGANFPEAVTPSEVARDTAINLADIAQVPADRDTQLAADAFARANELELGDALSLVAREAITNPRGMAGVVGETLGLTGPSAAAGVAGAGLGAVLGGAPGARVGLSAGEFGGGYGIETLLAYPEVARELNVDLTDPASVEAFVSDPAAQARVQEVVEQRALPVALAAALSGGVAGRLGRPAYRALGGGVTGAAGATAAELGAQAGIAGAGEAAAGGGTGDVLAEGLLEALLGVPEVAIGLGLEATQPAAPGAPVPVPAPPPAAPPPQPLPEPPEQPVAPPVAAATLPAIPVVPGVTAPAVVPPAVAAPPAASVPLPGQVVQPGYVGPIRPPLPGEEDFRGPLQPPVPPLPGEREFVGPTLPPQPGEREFEGPTRPPVPGEREFEGPLPAPAPPVEPEPAPTVEPEPAPEPEPPAVGTSEVPITETQAAPVRAQRSLRERGDFQRSVFSLSEPVGRAVALLSIGNDPARVQAIESNAEGEFQGIREASQEALRREYPDSNLLVYRDARYKPLENPDYDVLELATIENTIQDQVLGHKGPFYQVAIEDVIATDGGRVIVRREAMQPATLVQPEPEPVPAAEPEPRPEPPPKPSPEEDRRQQLEIAIRAMLFKGARVRTATPKRIIATVTSRGPSFGEDQSPFTEAEVQDAIDRMLERGELERVKRSLTLRQAKRPATYPPGARPEPEPEPPAPEPEPEPEPEPPKPKPKPRAKKKVPAKKAAPKKKMPPKRGGKARLPSEIEENFRYGGLTDEVIAELNALHKRTKHPAGPYTRNAIYNLQQALKGDAQANADIYYHTVGSSLVELIAAHSNPRRPEKDTKAGRELTRALSKILKDVWVVDLESGESYGPVPGDQMPTTEETTGTDTRYTAEQGGNDPGTPAPGAIENGRRRPMEGENTPYWQASMASRGSYFEWAIEAMGYDRDQFKLMPAEVQFRKLADFVSKLFGLRELKKTGAFRVQKAKGGSYVVNGIPVIQAIDNVLDMAVQLQRMSEVLGISNKAVGLEGKLGVLYRRNVPYFGVMMPAHRYRIEGTTVDSTQGLNIQIVLPRRSNSMAHEWFHALDVALFDRLGGAKRTSGLLSDWVSRVRKDLKQAMTDLGDLNLSRDQEMEKAFFELQHALFFEGDPWADGDPVPNSFAKSSAEFDNPNRPYFITAVEMSARAYEAWLSSKFSEREWDTIALAKESRFYDKTFLKPGYERFDKTFPKGAARDAIFARFDAFFKALAASDAYPTGEPNRAPENVYWNNPREFPWMQGDDQRNLGKAHDEAKRAGRKIVDSVKQRSQRASKRLSTAPQKVATEQKLTEKVARAAKESLGTVYDLVGPEPTDRPPNPVSTMRRVGNVLGMALMPQGGLARTIARRYNSASLWKIVDQIYQAPGESRRLVGETYEEEIHRLDPMFLGKLSRVAKNLGIDPDELTAADHKLLRELMTRVDPDSMTPEQRERAIDQGLDLARSEKPLDSYPQNFVKFAGWLRRSLDDLWYQLHQVGYDVGYTRNGFLPRQLDTPRVMDSLVEYKADVKKVYDFMFTGEYGEEYVDEVANDIMEKTPNPFNQLLNHLSRKGGPLEYDEAVAAYKDMRKQLQKLAQKARKAARDKDNPELKPEARERAASNEERYLREYMELVAEEFRAIFVEARDAVRDAYSDLQSEAHINALLQGNSDIQQYSIGGERADYLKRRTLPQQADEFLDKWYVQDPIQRIVTYTQSVHRRIAYGKRFGYQDEQLKEWVAQAGLDGVPHQEMQIILGIVGSVTGRKKSSVPPLIQTLLSYVHQFGNMALLGRALLSSLAEPATIAIRTAALESKGPVDALSKGLATAARGYYLTLQDLLRGLSGSHSARVRRELAMLFGTIGDAAIEALLHNRTGGTYEDTPQLLKRVGKFYRYTGLHPYTEATRAGTTSLALGAIETTLQRYRDNYNMAETRRELTRLGIPEDQVTNILAIMGRLPLAGRENQVDLVQGVDQEPGWEYLQLAVNRIVEAGVPSGTTASMPFLASNPVGRVVFAILRFQYRFGAVVVAQSYRRARDADAATRAQLLAGMAGGFAMLYAGQLAVTIVRERITSADKWEEKEEEGEALEWAMRRALDRTGIWGPIDPLVQAYTGIKYERDLANILVGAAPSWALQNVAKMLGTMTRNSEETNTAEFNATRAAYSLLVNPSLAYLVTSLPPAGWANWLYGAVLAYGTSSSASYGVAEAIHGPKGDPTGP